MPVGASINADFRNCYKCNKRLKLLERTCHHCGADNSKLKVFDILTRILIIVISILFAVIVVSFVVIFLMVAGVLPKSFGNLWPTISDLSSFIFVRNIFFVLFALGFITAIVALIGNMVRDSLGGGENDKAEAEGKPAYQIPSLEYAKKNFTPAQYNIIKIAVWFFFAVNMGMLLIVPIILFIGKTNSPWLIIPAFTILIILAALGYIATPIFIIGYILYFVFLVMSKNRKDK